MVLGSRGQKAPDPGSRIRIRNTEFFPCKKAYYVNRQVFF